MNQIQFLNIYFNYLKYIFYKKVIFPFTLINKKRYLKIGIIRFIKSLYIYLSSKKGETGDLEYGVPSIEELYLTYIWLVNYNLKFNKPEVDNNKMIYIYLIMKDFLSGIRTSKSSFIYCNQEDSIQKLKLIIREIIHFGLKEEYFTFQEFKQLMNNYRSGYLAINSINRYINTGKIPKRLKTRNRIK